MKFANLVLTFVSMIFISGAAQAVVMPDGTFIPSECGAQEKAEAGIAAICVGRIQGEQGRAVQFRMADSTQATFKVVNQTNMMVAMLSGNLKSNLFLQGVNGETSTMKAIVTRQGAVTAVSGQINGTEYFVPKLEIVFNIL